MNHRNDAHPSGDGGLLRALGVWGLAANIINVTVGGGIFRLPASAASVLGPAAPVAYLLCAVVMGLIVLCFAEAGSRVSLTGGLYAYARVAFGPLVGFIVGVMLWGGATTAMAAISSFFGDALAALVPAIGAGVGRTAIIAATLLMFTWLNVVGVSGANRFNVVMTVAKLLPLVVLVVAGVGAVHRANLTWTSAPPAGELARASTVLIFAFFGVESALVPNGEVREPARTIPRAIFLAMIGITVLYLGIQVVAQGVLGSALGGQKTPLAEAAAVAMGAPGRILILVGSVISMFGYVGGMTMAIPRMLFAFGRDGFLPAGVATVHSRYRTPVVAIILQTLIVLGLALSGSFERLAIIANGCILLVYGACCLAVLELRRRGVRETEAGAAAPFRIPLAGVVPLLALTAICWLLTSLTIDEWKALVVVIGVAIGVYAASMPSRRAAAVAAGADAA